MKRKTWNSGLTAAERKHLRESGATNMKAFLRNRAAQMNGGECLECRNIALKLMIETAGRG